MKKFGFSVAFAAACVISAFPAYSEEPLRLSVRDAILLSLENNRSLRVERFNPLIRETLESGELAAFDPVFSGSISTDRERDRPPTRIVAQATTQTITTGVAAAEVSKFYPTGTEVTAGISAQYTWFDLLSDLSVNRAEVSVTQALLRGKGLDVNLADLRQARLDTRISGYELRGFLETLVAQVEQTYWDYALARARIRIFQESLSLAQQQLQETEEIIRVGRMAETELAAARAEIARRRQDLIDARSDFMKARLRMIRLLNPSGPDPWDREVVLLDDPAVPEILLEEVDSHVRVAMLMRPDLNQARLLLQRDELTLVKTRNGLLPRLDLFITLGKTGYADSFDGGIQNTTGDSYDVLAGFQIQYPFKNRGAQADHERARYTRDQAEESIGNLAQLVEEDVRSAYIEVNRSREQISATQATAELQEETLRVEMEKFRVGRSTNFLVSQAQRDLVSSQILEIQAVVSYLQALVNLHRLEGSLLERRGLQASGREPVK